MVQAYILIQTEIGTSSDVTRKIVDIPGVVSADDVLGPYDVIALLEANTFDDLGEKVISRIQELDNITRTLTCTVIA